METLNSAKVPSPWGEVSAVELRLIIAFPPLHGFFLHPFTEPIKTSDLHNNKKEEHDNRTIVSLKSIFDGLIFTVLQTNLKQGCTKETFKSPVSFLNKVPVAY